MLRPIAENFGLPKHGGPSCCLASGKKGIRPCQGLTIWTSFYLLLLLSNSKKKTTTAISSQLDICISPSCLLYFTSSIHIELFGILHLRKATQRRPRCSTPDFSLRKKKLGAEPIFAFCRGSHFESSLVWLIFPPVLQSSLVIPLQHFGRAPQKWQMCSHGNRPVMPLSPLACQMKSSSAREEPAGDPTDLASVQQCDFWQPRCF